MILDIYGKDECEIEFVGGNGETLALPVLNGQADSEPE
ncbi:MULTISPECIES: hypothetical protein [unclassified Eikenella]